MPSWSCRLVYYLIPWPGPQAIFWIQTFLEPGPIAMQSSPVLIRLFLMVTPVDDWTMIPSVLGLRLGATILIRSKTILVHLLTATWMVWLYNEVTPLTNTLFDHMNVIDCMQHYMWFRKSSNDYQKKRNLTKVLTLTPAGQRLPVRRQAQNWVPLASMVPPWTVNRESLVNNIQNPELPMSW